MTSRHATAGRPATFVKLLTAAAIAAPLALGLSFGATGRAFALSEIQREELPPVQGQAPQAQTAPEGAAPQTPAGEAPAGEAPAAPAQGAQPPANAAPAETQPAPEAPAAPANPTEASPSEASPPGAPQPGQPATDEPGEPDDEGAPGAQARPDVDPNAPLPEISYDYSKLPEPVQRTRNLILEATKSGDPEKLRPLLGAGSSATQLSLTETSEDPIKFIVAQSGDDAGQEILAILEEVLEAGYAHLDAGTPEELYVWPYFYAYPLAKLTPQQKVEIYRIVTASDFEEMMTFGNYIFFRVGIAPDGRWAFFVAGE